MAGHQSVQLGHRNSDETACAPALLPFKSCGNKEKKKGEEEREVADSRWFICSVVFDSGSHFRVFCEPSLVLGVLMATRPLQLAIAAHAPLGDEPPRT